MGRRDTNQPVPASQRGRKGHAGGSPSSRRPPCRVQSWQSPARRRPLEIPCIWFPNYRNLIPPKRTCEYIPCVSGEKLCCTLCDARPGLPLGWFNGVAGLRSETCRPFLQPENRLTQVFATLHSIRPPEAPSFQGKLK